MMLRVLVADKVEINRVGFRAVLDGLRKRVSIVEAATQPELINGLKNFDYDLVVVEPAMAEESGEALLRKIRQVAPLVNILVLTMLVDLNFGFKAIRCGARGFLTKSCTADELSAAVLAVGAGKVYITPELAELIAERKTDGVTLPTHEFLSDREFLVFSMLVAGSKVSEIARLLRISVKTISTHKSRVLYKLQVKSISDLVKYAISQGLIEECNIRCKAAIAKATQKSLSDPRHKSALPEPAVGKHTGTNSSKVLRFVGRNRT